MNTALCIDDLRRLAHRRVPRMFIDYLESGSWSESTLRANGAAWAAMPLRQRVAVDVSQRNLATPLVGHEASLPLLMAPLGLLGMQRADGEVLAARACAAAGIPFVLSTMSICPIESVAAASPAPIWFQLYLMRDRGVVGALIDRARAAGCRALVLTLDLQVLGKRHRDTRNGLSTPPRLTPRTLLDLALHPAWCARLLRARHRGFGNLTGLLPAGTDTRSLVSWIETQFDPAVTWRDVEWVRAQWDGPLVIKGVLDPEDARHAVERGADALVVSNHGGRQLDGAPASAHALPRVLDAVGERAEVHVDGGIGSGQDLLRALALGARAAWSGRALAYGLAADGERGVARAIAILREELDRSMALTGQTDATRIGRDALV
ncbi:MAG: alpha-hydroxy-acid oxidizing protein [Rhodocyclaceae bacterium]|nr:alpha-hydroxy-acid oxidizing protein [Rhodocyclaceae bacterium]